MKATVIIPTKNRATLLEATLLSLSKQDISYDDYEVIIIDNGSTDNTRLVCNHYSKIFRHFIYIYDERPGLHTGRNLGLLKSSTNILIYADDDIIVPENWISAIISGFEDPDVVLIGGNDIPNFEDTPPSWVHDLWYTDEEGNRLLLPFSCIDMGNTKKYIKANYVFGCNFSIRKPIVMQTKGFHPDGMPAQYIKFRGDGETFVSNFITRNKLKTLFLPEASVKHYVSKGRMTHEYVDSIKFRNGISNRFTMLRENPSIFNAIKEYIRILLQHSSDYYEKGNKFLLINYIKSKKLRKWVTLDNYLDVSINDYL